MNQQASAPAPAGPKAKKDRWVRLAFLAAAIVAAVVVWSLNRRPGLGWSTNLDHALQVAAKDNRPVVVLFINSPPGDTDRAVIDQIIKKAANQQALKQGNFLQVLQEGQTQAALQYDVRPEQLPVLLRLGPDGQVLKRRDGKIGETEFRREFLEDPAGDS